MIAALSACGDSESSTASGSSPSTTSTTGTPAATTTNSSSSPTAPPSSTPTTVKKASAVKLSSASYAVPGAAGTAVITVERTGSTGAAVIQYSTVNGSAKSGVDYTGGSGKLTWSDGDTSIKKIYVPVVEKGSGKKFSVSLKASDASATVASPDTATVSITAPAEVLPAAAELAGYRTQTFGPSMKMNSNWYNMTFYGWSGSGGVNNSDGSVSIAGSGIGTISTAKYDKSKPNRWSGIAFGGGAYFEAELSFKNADEEDPGMRWPAFWANDIENMASSDGKSTQWIGQPEGFGNWVEVDIMEYCLRKIDKYGFQIHNWYGMHTHHQVKDVPVFKKAMQLPADFKWSDMHKYGFLWVPATKTTQGYAQMYLDDAPAGDPVYWNKYDPKAPPAPIIGTTAASVLDARHLALILDTGTHNPMTVRSVAVWQKSADNNLTE